MCEGRMLEEFGRSGKIIDLAELFLTPGKSTPSVAGGFLSIESARILQKLASLLVD